MLLNDTRPRSPSGKSITDVVNPSIPPSWEIRRCPRYVSTHQPMPYVPAEMSGRSWVAPVVIWGDWISERVEGLMSCSSPILPPRRFSKSQRLISLTLELTDQAGPTTGMSRNGMRSSSSSSFSLYGRAWSGSFWESWNEKPERSMPRGAKSRSRMATSQVVPESWPAR